MIKVALPNKGQLFEPTVEILTSCGYKVSKSPKSLSSLDPENNVEFYFLRPGDIPLYVASGVLDAGITGKDFAAEKGQPSEPLLDLNFGYSKLCAAVLVDDDAHFKATDGELLDNGVAVEAGRDGGRRPHQRAEAGGAQFGVWHRECLLDVHDSDQIVQIAFVAYRESAVPGVGGDAHQVVDGVVGAQGGDPDARGHQILGGELAEPQRAVDEHRGVGVDGAVPRRVAHQ